MEKHSADLLGEDRWGDFSVRHWCLTAPDRGQFALTQVISKAGEKKAPLVFLPGMFSNRHFWMTSKGLGLAAYLTSQGHDAWLIERRETGLSPRSAGARAGLREAMRHDLPCVQAFVAEQSGESAFWLGHSFGGVSISLALAGHLDASLVRGLVLFAAQFEVGKPMLRWPARIFVQGIARLRGYFPARRLGLGPENEPVAAMDDACQLTTSGQRHSRLQSQLQSISCPVFALVGGGDTVDPPEGCERLISHMTSQDKTFYVASRASGCKEDYNHPGIVVSKGAAVDIWPRVADWLAAR